MSEQNEKRIADLLNKLKGNMRQSTTNAVLLCLDGNPQMFESIYRNFSYKKSYIGKTIREIGQILSE
jgi:hypothetical protein